MTDGTLDKLKHKKFLTHGADRWRELKGFLLCMALVSLCIPTVWGASDEQKPLKNKSEVAWGQEVAGLRIGIVLPVTTAFGAVVDSHVAAGHGKYSIEIEILIENVGKSPLFLHESINHPWNWIILFTPTSGEKSLRAVLHPPPKPIFSSSEFELPPGGKQRLLINCAHWISIGDEENYENIRSTLPAGSYLISGHYQSPKWQIATNLWRGTIVTGMAKLQIARD